MTVDASKVDLNFLDPSKMVVGKDYLIQSLLTSRDGRVYGRIWINYLGNNQVSINSETYDFNQDGAFFSNFWRNSANAVGKFFAGEGKAFQINFKGVNTIHPVPYVPRYDQTAHEFKL